jgi:hypothetical protein
MGAVHERLEDREEWAAFAIPDGADRFTLAGALIVVGASSAEMLNSHSK